MSIFLMSLYSTVGCSDLTIMPDLSFEFPGTAVWLGCLHDFVPPDCELGAWVSFSGRWLVMLDREHPAYLNKPARTGLTQAICAVLSSAAVSLR